MSRLAVAFWLLLVLASGFTTFMVKYAVQGIEEQLYRVRKQTIAEQQEIRVLTAEWAYLNKPERLADLNRRFLGLVPVTPHQLEGRIDQIAFRAPTVPPVMPERMVASAAALAPAPPIPAAAVPRAPAPVAMVTAANPPATPPAAAASPATADPLDALIAQVEANGLEAPNPAGAPQGAAPQTAHAASHSPLDALLTLIEPAAASAAPIAAAPPQPPLRLAKISPPPRSLSALIARVAGKP